MIDDVLREHIGKICYVYIDDIIVFGEDYQSHWNNLRAVFQNLRKAKLHVNLEKTRFLSTQVEFLGYIVTQDGIKANAQKVKAITDMKPPANMKELKSFLGMTSYYRKFIQDYAKVAKPLTNLTRGEFARVKASQSRKVPIELDDVALQAFNDLKAILASSEVLAFPDFNKPFHLTTDASDYAIGAVLSQDEQGKDRPIAYISPARIYKYDAPVVPLQQGGVWRINGMFKLVHVIDISRMMQLVDETSRDAATLTDQRINTITRHYLEQAAEGMNRVMRPTSRRARAVNWLGSAWKWIAGSPDAEDWNAVLNSEKMITENINQQIRINARLFDASHKSIQELNDVQLSWLTCQLAKTGVTNSNLLDHEEIETILTEVNDLPYQNAVEAVEFSRPTVLSNGTTLLYILALPKVSNRRYELVRLYPTVSGGRQIVLEHQKLALNGEETYAVVGSCSSIGNITVCPEEDLIALEENSCIPRLLKGGHASCSYLRSNEEVVQLVEDGTLFLSNYNGSLATPEREYQLEGTYIVQFNNEVVTVRNKNFTAYSANHPMALPPVLTNITVTGYRPSLGYVDDVNAQNTQVMSGVSRGVTFSYVLEASLTLIVFLILFIIWRKLTSTEGIPTTRVITEDLENPKRTSTTAHHSVN
ncbi:hypothetical protein KR067_009813 [Drosophila pandora]|nr:hypothetical protein KR067_009813 [Drosophila pandora]